jgi:Zn-dependent M28 family amino/carboxypeptidase
VLRDHSSLSDLRFVLFGGEEQGLFGSAQYVASLSSSQDTIDRINYDLAPEILRMNVAFVATAVGNGENPQGSA